jgi:hypothetical protein
MASEQIQVQFSLLIEREALIVSMSASQTTDCEMHQNKAQLPLINMESVLQVHSHFQRKFPTDCDLVLLLSSSCTFSFP